MGGHYRQEVTEICFRSKNDSHLLIVGYDLGANHMNCEIVLIVECHT